LEREQQASPLASKSVLNKIPSGPGFEKVKTKKFIKDVHNDEIEVLNGQIKANIKLNKFDDDDRDKEKPVYTYQQHRLLLKKNGVTYFERYEAPKKESD
jgi:hypothetical protein